MNDAGTLVAEILAIAVEALGPSGASTGEVSARTQFTYEAALMRIVQRAESQHVLTGTPAGDPTRRLGAE